MFYYWTKHHLLRVEYYDFHLFVSQGLSSAILGGKFQGVDLGTTDFNRPVQVRTSRPAGATDLADRLTSFELLPDLAKRLQQVGIKRIDTAAMIEDYRASGVIQVADINNPAVGRSPNQAPEW